MKTLKEKKGFTLAELLIVVAIIAVLTTVAIPVFTNQLEKSREATDIANVRSAYSELVTTAMTDGTNSSYYVNQIMSNDEVYKTTVPLKQKKADWQNTNNLIIASTSSTDSLHWLGTPSPNGICEITYNASTSGIFIKWNASNLAANIDIQDGCWNGPAASKDRQLGKMVSTYNPDDSKYPGLYELEGNTTYKVTFTYTPHFDNPDQPTKGIIGRANILWDSNRELAVDTGSGVFNLDQDNAMKGGTFRYTANKDGTITYTATFTTPSTDSTYYYGMNFGGRNIKANGTTSGDLKFTSFGATAEQDFMNELKNSFIIEKAQ